MLATLMDGECGVDDSRPIFASGVATGSRSPLGSPGGVMMGVAARSVPAGPELNTGGGGPPIHALVIQLPPEISF